MAQAPCATVEQYTAGDDLEFEGVVTRGGSAIDLTDMTVAVVGVDIVAGTQLLNDSAPLSNVAVTQSEASQGKYRVAIAGAVTLELSGLTVEISVRITDVSGKSFTVVRRFWYFRVPLF